MENGSLERRTVEKYGEALYEVKKSRFIGYCSPVNTREEAEAFVDSIKKKHPDARHNVYAWILKKETNLQKYSDDGEPSGTAGLPVMSVLTKNGLTDLAVVVTRYFGGILLGKGGLVRAYTKACNEAVKAANPVTVRMCAIFETVTDYKNSERIAFEIGNRGWNITDTIYGADVTLVNHIPVEEEEKFKDFVFDISNGRIVPVKTGETEAVAGQFEFEEENIKEDE